MEHTRGRSETAHANQWRQHDSSNRGFVSKVVTSHVAVGPSASSALHISDL